MAALRVQDFDMLRRRVNVSRSVPESGGLQWSTQKSWERHSAPFPTALAEELAALMTGKLRDDLVFADQRGGVHSNWRARVFRSPSRGVRPQTTRSLPSHHHHTARPAAHGSQSRRQCAGQHEAV